MLAPAVANVVWQLSHRPVGRAVAHGRGARGSLFRHPLRRTRTTLGYIWVTQWGDDGERAAMRRAVDSQHRNVRSRPGDEVAYDAYDSSLQLWVAACMYVGARQGYEALYGDLDATDGTELLARCGRFATGLQVPVSLWPGDLGAFEEYWRDGVSRVAFDEVTRGYLLDFVAARYLPRPVAWGLAPLSRLLAGGFLDEGIRTALGLTWTPRDDRRFSRFLRAMRAINRWTPPVLARLPWPLIARDCRRRVARGHSLV